MDGARQKNQQRRKGTTMAETKEVARRERFGPRRLLDRFGWPGAWPFEELIRLEEFVDGDELVIRAEMPGLDPDKDVDIQAVDHSLRIRAERREESEKTEKGGYRSEFHYGSFSRTVPLPAGAAREDVKATYKDGILEVRLPIDRTEAEATKIPIERR
jgi:HSP20 family protein